VFTLLVLLWMVMIIVGGKNGWDKRRDVRPFAPHNVAIAALAGLWMIPPAMYIACSPLRIWRKLRRTYYALTDRRAFVIAPDRLGRSKTKSFAADTLRLIRAEQHHDGTGDLIFASPSNWAGMAEQVGFLGIDDIGDVEALLWRTLLSKAHPQTDSSAPGAAKIDPSTSTQKCYQLSVWLRLFQFVFLAAGSLVTLCIVGNIILVALLLAMGPESLFGPRPPGVKPLTFGGLEIAAVIVAGLGSLLMGVVVCALFFHFALCIPIEIKISEDRDIHFRARLRSVTIPVSDIQMIRTGGWFDPNRFQAVVRYKGGKLILINHFSDFTDFLATVKELNPSVEIKGF
jgi:hypothetical protein